MPRTWADLAEQRIRKAEAEGQLRGLPGEGRPLPQRPGDALIDPGLAVGYRIMAEAGALPKEIHLKKALEAARAAWAAAEGAEAKTAAMKAIADLEMRLAIEQEARRKFLGG